MKQTVTNNSSSVTTLIWEICDPDPSQHCRGRQCLYLVLLLWRYVMDLMITLLGTDTVRSTDFPVHWLKRQAPSHFKSAQSNLILIIDRKIKLLYPTADNKVWVAIFSWDNKGVIMCNDWPQHRASCQQWPVPMSAIFPRSASHSMLRMVGWVIFRLNVGAGAVRQHYIVCSSIFTSILTRVCEWQESVECIL